MTQTQKRTLGMHPNLLMDVIQRQAGSISKALLEAVMNSIDAGASRCDITLETERFSVVDDGRGFQSQQEIDAHFETFGTPHQEGDATYGRFRMGRGQLMAFGRNRWVSNVFRMDVDIKVDGLDYHLTVAPEAEAVSGCRIEVELYDPMLPSDLERTGRELRDMVAYAQVPVRLNGKTISRPPHEQTWDHEDDNAYLSLSDTKATLDVYNLGVLVCRHPAHLYGTGGVVVSKKQLTVNFARNDVQRSCPVWREIAKHLQAQQTEKNTRKARLTDAERQHLAERLVAGEIGHTDAGDLKVITDVTGRHHKIHKLMEVPFRFQRQLTVADRGDQVAETAQKRRLCFAVARETLERFDVASGEELLRRIGESLDAIDPNRSRKPAHATSVFHLTRKINVISRDSLSELIDDDHVLLADKEIKAAEKLLLQAIQRGNNLLSDALRRQEEIPHSGQRTLRLGVSETALAWTDGRTFIAIDRRHAALAARGISGCYQVAMTLLHEYVHDTADTGSHTHDHAFYEAFHNLASDHELDPVGKCATAMHKALASALRKAEKRPNQSVLLHEDNEAVTDRLARRMDLPAPAGQA